MLRRCLTRWCAAAPAAPSAVSTAGTVGVHALVASIEDFPRGWRRLTPRLAARAELGVGYHDDPRLVNDHVPESLREQANKAYDHHQSHQPYSAVSPVSPSPLPQETADAIARAGGNNDAESYTHAIKEYDMGDFGGVYRWMGLVAGLAREYDVDPIFNAFFTSVTVTLPLTEAGRKVAFYMNQQEIRQAPRRNTSDGVVADEEANELMISSEVLDRVEARAFHSFCWILNNDKVNRDNFNQEIFLQWHHRADYLVKRKAREKKEFRDQMTLEQLLKSASQNRRRRVAQVEERDRLRAEAQKIPSPPNFRAHAKRANLVANRNSRAEVVRKSLAVPDGVQNVNQFKSSANRAALAAKEGPIIPPPLYPNAEEMGSARDVGNNFEDDGIDGEDDSPIDHSGEQDGSISAKIEANRRARATGSAPKKVRTNTDVVLDVLPREMRESMDGGDLEDGMDDVRLGGGNAPRYLGRFKM